MRTHTSDVTPGYQFASDNTAGICPEAWESMQAANAGFAPSYGADAWTEGATVQVRALLGRPDAAVFFVFNGTASNALSLAHLARSYHGIVCHESAHVQTDECAAPEFFAGGAKLVGLPGPDARLSADAVRALLAGGDNPHFPKLRALSLSQSTEWGTFYRPDEIAALAAVAHERGLSVHMDGARFANVMAASSGVTAADLTWRAGVDVLSLGGTKNGLNTTEAVVFFDPALGQEFAYRVKQGGQLASKMRFQTCQWQAVLQSGAWLRNAWNANEMAQRLGAAIASIPGIRLARPVEVNAVFVEMSAALAAAMQSAGWHFHYMRGAGHRLMCSWATSEADVDAFVHDLQRLSHR
jgi:threonine aldolase